MKLHGLLSQLLSQCTNRSHLISITLTATLVDSLEQYDQTTQPSRLLFVKIMVSIWVNYLSCFFQMFYVVAVPNPNSKILSRSQAYVFWQS